MGWSELKGFTQHLALSLLKAEEKNPGKARIISKLSAGFTIVELSIATAVFAVVLLVALAGFFEIGKLFYKGVSISQTQETADQIFQDVNGNFQTAASVSPKQTFNGYTYYCIGNSRYTFNINNEVDLASSSNHAPPFVEAIKSGNFGILKDILPGSGAACSSPCNDQSGVCTAGSVKFNNPTELLGEKMRVEKFDITAVANNPNLYNVSLIIAYGDDDVLGWTDSSKPETAFCKGGSTSQQFCAVSSLNTGIYRGRH